MLIKYMCDILVVFVFPPWVHTSVRPKRDGLHVEDVCAAILYVLDHSIEAGAAGTFWHGNGVHVEFYGNNTTLITFAHLICDVEDKG